MRMPMPISMRVCIAMRMVVAVFMAVAVAGPVAMAMAVGMPVTLTPMGMSVLECEDADQVDKETQHGNDEEALMFHLRWFNGSLNSLREDEERNEEQEEAIDKSCKNFCTHVPIREPFIGSPLCDD